MMIVEFIAHIMPIQQHSSFGAPVTRKARWLERGFRNLGLYSKRYFLELKLCSRVHVLSDYILQFAVRNCSCLILG